MIAVVVYYLKLFFAGIELTVVLHVEMRRVQVQLSGFVDCLLGEVRGRLRVEQSLGHIELIVQEIFLRLLDVPQHLHSVVPLPESFWPRCLVEQLLVKVLTAVAWKIHARVGLVHTQELVPSVVFVIKVH